MKLQQQVVFWIFALIGLSILFQSSFNSWIYSFYFVSMLMPTILLFSFMFNAILLPKYLISKDYISLGIHSLYLLIGAVYLQMWVLIFSFILIANYKIENIGSLAKDVKILAVIMLLIVLIQSLFFLVKQLSDRDSTIHKLEDQQKLDSKKFIPIRWKRRIIELEFSKILFIESLKDYIIIHMADESFKTKQRIGQFSKQLPTGFLRIHRSFIVNKSKISSYNKEFIFVREQQLPISRSYKQNVFSVLNL